MLDWVAVREWWGLPAAVLLTERDYACATLFVAGVLFWSAVFFLSGPLSSALTSSYAKLSWGDRQEWRTRVTSNLHAVYTVCVGAYYLTGKESVFIGGNAFNGQLFFFSCGYFFEDLVCCLVVKQIRSKATLLHHSMGIVYYSLAGRNLWTMYFANFFYLTELTTPFINQRFFFDRCDMKARKRFLVNGVLMWIGWVIVRLPLSPMVAYYVLTRTAEFLTLPRHWQLMSFVSWCVITFLNYYWFYLLTRGILTKLGVIGAAKKGAGAGSGSGSGSGSSGNGKGSRKNK